MLSLSTCTAAMSIVMHLTHINTSLIADNVDTSQVSVTLRNDLDGLIVDGIARKSFQSVFENISKQRRVTIVAEGVPLRPVLTDDEVRSLNSVLATDKMVPLDQAITELANAFDYNVERPGTNIFLLSKRYTDSADLPYVTYDEVAHAFESIERIVSGDFKNSSYLSNNLQMELANSLTPEQLQKASDGLPISQLTPDQRTLAIEVAKCLVLRQDLLPIHEAVRRIKILGEGRTVLKWMQLGGHNAFGYAGPFGPSEGLWEIPLNNGFVSQVGRGEVYQVGGAVVAVKSTVPTEQDYLLCDGMTTNRLPSTRKLEEFALEMNKSGTVPIRISVDSRIKDKPICVFGEAYSSPDKLVRSVGTLFGLRVIQPTEGSYGILLPQSDPVGNIFDIPEAVNRMFPLPLLHAVERISVQDVGHDIASPIVVKQTKFSSGQHESRVSDIALAADLLYYPAVRRLLALVLPVASTRESPGIPVATYKPEALRLTSLVTISGEPIVGVENLIHMQVPVFLKNSDSIFIQVVKGNTELVTAFGTGRRLPNGRMGFDYINVLRHHRSP